MLSKLHLVLITCKYPPFVFLLLIRPVVLISASLQDLAGAKQLTGFRAVGDLGTAAVTVANTPQSPGNHSWGLWEGLEHCGCGNGAG